MAGERQASKAGCAGILPLESAISSSMGRAVPNFLEVRNDVCLASFAAVASYANNSLRHASSSLSLQASQQVNLSGCTFLLGYIPHILTGTGARVYGYMHLHIQR